MEQLTTEDLKVIVFQLTDEEYAIPVDQVGSIERMLKITRVPQASHFVKGVINLRGVIMPVIDLRSRFELEETDFTDSTRIIIVHLAELEIGLIVDSANDVIDISKDAIEPPPSVVGSVDANYIEGVAKLEDRLLILLNLDKVLSTEEVEELKSVEGS